MSEPSKKKNAQKKKARDEFQEDEIFQAPVITREPSSRQAKLGSKVVLRVTASGKPLPSFQWYHNGQKIAGATTDRLTLTKVRRQAAGAYHCEAKNFVGKTTSRICMLSFFTQRLPKLVVAPAEQKVEEGKPIAIKILSPPAAELKDFKVYWVFNGMRIKGALGLELNISAMKKKYEGEYKAMIAAGGGLETSNVATLTMTAASARPAAPAPAPVPAPAPATQEVALSMEDILSREPTQAMARPEPIATPAADWEDFLFNPEEDEEKAAPTRSPAPEIVAEEFGQSLSGQPGHDDRPLSQLGTQELIREISAEGGASELIESLSGQDPSLLILGTEHFNAPPAAAADLSHRLSEAAAPSDFPVSEDPSGLIELAAGRDAPSTPPPQEDPSGLIETAAASAFPESEDPSGLIERLESRAPVAVPPPPPAILPATPPPRRTGLTSRITRPTAPDPKLSQKKEFLQNLLSRWQARTGKKNGQAA